MTWLTVTEYLCHKLEKICSVCRNHNPVLFAFMTYPHTGFVTRRTRRVPHAKQELFTLPEHMRLPLVCSGVRVTRSLVFFVDSCLSLCPSFGLCIVCHSSIYGFWLPVWFLHTFPMMHAKFIMERSAHRLNRQYK